MIELWNVIPSNPRYLASIYGRVMNSERGRVLTPWAHKSGHLSVRLGRGKNHLIHHLVMEAFGKKRKVNLEVRHLNGIPVNNLLGNLAWGTRQENVDDLKRTSGKFAKSIFSDDVVMDIKKSYTGKWGEKTKLAMKYGVSESTIGRIIKGETYAHTRN